MYMRDVWCVRGMFGVYEGCLVCMRDVWCVRGMFGVYGT